jgi:PAS domain S-box-containing protein
VRNPFKLSIVEFHKYDTRRTALTQIKQPDSAKRSGHACEFIPRTCFESFTRDLNRLASTPCWKIKECHQANCPAYNQVDLRCWRLLDTLCPRDRQPDINDNWHHCLICPVFDAHAEADPRGWKHFFSDEVMHFIKRDISERKGLAADLKRSESKYHRIFEGSKDMIFITAKDEKIKDVNQAGLDLMGYTNKQEVLSLVSVEKLYSNPRHWRVFQKQIDLHGYVKDFEARFKKKDGTLIHCLLSGNAVRSSAGDIIGYEGIVKDVTARMDAVRKLQQRHQELLLLNSVALAINTAGDLDDLLMTALKEILRVLNLSSGAIFLVDHAKIDFSLSAQQGLYRSSTGSRSQIIIHDEVLMQSLLKKSLLLKPKPTFPPFKADLKIEGGANPIQLTCFLITAKEKASGFLAFDVPVGRNFTRQDLHLLGSIGNFLGGAIENAQLHQTIHQHREELKRLTAKLFHSQELERRRIARELHDEAGQALTGINFTLETIENELSPELGPIRKHVSDIKKQINRTYHEMRRISYRLHPALLSDLGLEPALETYLKNVAKHSELKIDFKMVGFRPRVDPEIEIVLYRLSQEALTNTLRHSGAKYFKLSIIKSYPDVIFIAEDNGVGFHCDDFDEHKQALGLLSMRERVAMLGGKFSLRTSKGNGTRIRIEIPLKESA